MTEPKIRREWIATREGGLDGLGKMLDAFIKDVLLMTPEEKSAIKSEIRDGDLLVYLDGDAP